MQSMVIKLILPSGHMLDCLSETARARWAGFLVHPMDGPLYVRKQISWKVTDFWEFSHHTKVLSVYTFGELGGFWQNMFVAL